MNYEQALSIWGARKLGLPDDTEGVRVNFDFGAWSILGCETCGPDVEKEITVTVYGPDRKRWSNEYTLYLDDGDSIFKEILSELVEISSSS